jgi:putative ABC transport system substrate-binding protein
MKRREFITLVGGAAAAWPVVAHAQQAMLVIGYLDVLSASAGAPFVAAFRRGLNETGFVEGRNLVIEYRYAEGHIDQLPSLAAELVQRGVKVIATSGGSASALAAQATTNSIPIVFTSGDVDPVEAGLVKSLSQPGGIITGVSLLGGVLGTKRLEIIRELVPTARTVAVLVNPNNKLAERHLKEIEAAIDAAGQKIVVLRASMPSEFEPVFEKVVRDKADALLVTADGLYTNRRVQLVALAAKYRVPTIYQWREFVESGGLVSYGTNLAGTQKQVGTYVGRILKGAKPGDLPVVQPATFELVLNLRTANALGLIISPTMLGRADDVIE